jgi:hypothetical protein
MVPPGGTTGGQSCSILLQDVVMEYRGRAVVRKTQTGASWQPEPCIELDELLAADSDMRLPRGE